MADVFFISESYFKEMSGVNDNVDFKLIRRSIITAQDFYIQKILGTPLFNDLKTKLTADNTLASYPNEKDLLDNYIAKTLVCYVKIGVGIATQYQYMNKAVITKNLENGTAITTQDLKYLNQELKNEAELYAQLLTRHLKLNIGLFPKYAELTLDGMNPTQRNFTNGIYMKNYYGEENQREKGVNGSDIILD